MKSPMVYIIASVFFIMHFNVWVSAEKKSGPYNAILERVESCEDEGTGEIKIGTKVSKKGHNLYTYTNNVTFAIPYDSTVRYYVELQQFKSGAYVPRFMTQDFKSCEKAMKVMRPIITDFLAAANYTVTGCPIPAATYEVRDWVVRIEFSNIPTLYYSQYKMINIFYKGGKRVGCFTIYGNVVPKDM